MQIDENSRIGLWNLKGINATQSLVGEDEEAKKASLTSGWTHSDPAAFAYDEASVQAFEARMASGTTYYHAQAIGQGEPIAEGLEEKGQTEEAAEMSESAEEEFLAFMKMTPEERILHQILKEEGMTKEQFDALPPHEQRKILAKVKDRLETMLGTDEHADSARRMRGAMGDAQFMPDPLMNAWVPGGLEKA